jgi:hypothetical protein
MTETEEFKSLRRLALASLGRNVLHFQRLESQLKLLTLFCDFQSPLSQFTTNHKKRADSIRMKTLGTVVSELHERLYGKPSDPETSKAIAEASLTIQFRVDADPDYVNQQKQKLSDLVTERNRLIHQDIGDFNPASAESCQHWIMRLDDQNERILAQLREVHDLVNTFREGFQKTLAAMNTDEWKRGFKPRSERP